MFTVKSRALSNENDGFQPVVFSNFSGFMEYLTSCPGLSAVKYIRSCVFPRIKRIFFTASIFLCSFLELTRYVSPIFPLSRTDSEALQ